MNYLPVSFTQPAVRHLHWAIFSPELADTPNVPTLNIQLTPELNQWLTKLDAEPSALMHFLSENDHQLLGSYFEVLWQFFLSHAPNWVLLGSGVQIQSDCTNQQGVTLGELDILCGTVENPAIHLELAVKFFLLKPECLGDKLNHWIGPQTRDRLDLKLTKLSEKQFPFYFHHQTQQHLTQAELPTNAAQRLCLKGYLFRHISQSGKPVLPDAVNPNANLAHWCRANELASLKDLNQHWCIIEKSQWPGPYRTENKPLSFDIIASNIQNHFDQKKKENHSPATSDCMHKNKPHRSPQPPYAIMLVAMTPLEGSWYETKRFMVVHNNWPNNYKSEESS